MRRSSRPPPCVPRNGQARALGRVLDAVFMAPQGNAPRHLLTMVHLAALGHSGAGRRRPRRPPRLRAAAAQVVWWGEGPLPLALDLIWRNAARLEPIGVLIPPGRRARVEGVSFPIVHGLRVLAAISATVDDLSPSLLAWSVAAKLALDLVARGRIVPALPVEDSASVGRWAAALASADDAERVAALARAMPPASHAIPCRPA